TPPCSTIVSAASTSIGACSGAGPELSSCRGIGRMVRRPRFMRRSAWWVGGMVVAAACAARPSAPAPAELAAVSPAQGAAAQLVADAAAEHPVLADYVLYFQARAARVAGRADSALESARRLVGSHPDSIWVGPAWLLAGQLERAGGDPAGARASPAPARRALPGPGGRRPPAPGPLARAG